AVGGLARGRRFGAADRRPARGGVFAAHLRFDLRALGGELALARRAVIEKLEAEEDRQREADGEDHVPGFVGPRPAARLHQCQSLSVVARPAGLARMRRGSEAPGSRSAASLINALFKSSSKAAQSASGVDCRATST